MKNAVNTEEKLSSIFRVAPTGIGFVKNRIIQEVNPRICEMTGYSEKELIGQSARMLYLSDEEFNFVGSEKYAQIARQGTGIVETRWQRKDGSIINVLLASTPLEPSDLSLGVAFTALDFTERKLMQDALIESERNLSTLMNNLPGMAYRCKNDMQWTLLFVSSGCKDLTGYKPESIIENLEVSYAELIHPDDMEMVRQTTQNALDQGRMFILEYRIIDRDGKEKWVWEKGLGVKGEGNKDKWIEGVIMDITDRKKVEIELRKLKEELEVQVDDKTRELQERIRDLERFHEATIDREYRMKELRDEIEALKKTDNNIATPGL